MNEPNDKLEYIRICIYRLLKSKSPKIVKDGKKGKEYLYSLKENAETLDILLDELYDIMIKYMKPKEVLPKEKLEFIDKIGEIIENE